jgi:hypothetical protein
MIGGEAHGIRRRQTRIDMTAAPSAGKTLAFRASPQCRGLSAECMIAITITIALRHGTFFQRVIEEVSCMGVAPVIRAGLRDN